MSDLSNVRLWVSVLPVDPMTFPRPRAAADFLARHRRCYREHRTLVDSRIIETGAHCRCEWEHSSLASLLDPRLPAGGDVRVAPTPSKETTT